MSSEPMHSGGGPGQTGVSDLMLDRYLADELSAGQRAELEACCQQSELLRQRLAQRRREREAFYAQRPPAQFAHRVAVRIEHRAEQKKRRPWWLWLGAPSLAAAATVVLAFGYTQWLEAPDRLPAPVTGRPLESMAASAPEAAAQPAATPELEQDEAGGQQPSGYRVAPRPAGKAAPGRVASERAAGGGRAGGGRVDSPPGSAAKRAKKPNDTAPRRFSPRKAPEPTSSVGPRDAMAPRVGEGGAEMALGQARASEDQPAVRRVEAGAEAATGEAEQTRAAEAPPQIIFDTPPEVPARASASEPAPAADQGDDLDVVADQGVAAPEASARPPASEPAPAADQGDAMDAMDAMVDKGVAPPPAATPMRPSRRRSSARASGAHKKPSQGSAKAQAATLEVWRERLVGGVWQQQRGGAVPVGALVRLRLRPATAGHLLVVAHHAQHRRRVLLPQQAANSMPVRSGQQLEATLRLTEPGRWTVAVLFSPRPLAVSQLFGPSKRTAQLPQARQFDGEQTRWILEATP